jgi:hypothetical protein
MKVFFFILSVSLSIMLTNCSPSTKIIQSEDSPDNELVSLLNQNPQYFDSILKNKDSLNVQVIYTKIDRDKDGEPIFTDYYFNVKNDKYYYPASTVKLPIAILALQKLNELKIEGLDMNTTMITEAADDAQTKVYNDPTTPDGRPTIAHYIKKILLVSDNDAFNRLYEFLGQQYINDNLHKMGYEDVQIIHRLNIFLTEAQNRSLNPVRFIDTSGKTIYEKPLEKSTMMYAPRNTRLGKGFMRGDQLVNEPFDFSKKNRMVLTDLHSIVRSVMFPGSVSAKQRFNLTKADYEFLHRYMSMLPRESAFPSYDTAEYPDTYVKHYMFGNDKKTIPPAIRIFNKTGDAYGFLIDASYVADFDNGVEFMITSMIACNSDGIFNDDHYDYDTLGYPFLKHLGQVIYDYEIKRERKYKPDLSTFRYVYAE